MSVDDIVDPTPPAAVAGAAPADGPLRQLATRGKPILLAAFKVGLAAAATLVVNALLLMIAIPIGIAIDELFWAIAVTELGLLVVCLIAGAILVLRARRSVGAGLMVGWAVGYVGLIGIVVALIVAVIVIVAVACVLFLLLNTILAVIAS